MLSQISSRSQPPKAIISLVVKPKWHNLTTIAFDDQKRKLELVVKTVEDIWGGVKVSIMQLVP